MHPDEAGFVARIVADPVDDTHRLVFADWLEERGEEDRPAFIRLQILGPVAAGLGGDPNDALDRLRRLIPAALKSYADAAPPELATYLRTERGYARGLLRRVWAPARELAGRLDRLVTAAPVTEVETAGDGPALAEFVGRPGCRRLRRLTLTCSRDADPLADALLRADHLDGLQELWVRWFGDSDDAPDAPPAPVLGRLRERYQHLPNLIL